MRILIECNSENTDKILGLTLKQIEELPVGLGYLKDLKNKPLFTTLKEVKQNLKHDLVINLKIIDIWNVDSIQKEKAN